MPIRPKPIQDLAEVACKFKFPQVPQTANSLLEQLRITPFATSAEFGETLSVSPRMIKKYHKILKEANAIARVGSNRKGYWRVDDANTD